MIAPVALDVIASAMGVQVARVQRVAREIRRGKRTSWHGSEVSVEHYGDVPMMDFCTLATSVRERVMMLDQMPLPFTPPRLHTIN